MNSLDIYNGKNVLVTGHTGFKGSWLVAILEKFGANVTGYSLAPQSDPSHIKLLNIKSKSYIADIRNYERLEQVCKEIKPDIIFHLAAQALVKDSYSNPINTYTTNVIGSCNIFEVAKKTENIKGIVNVTTDKCYENKEWQWGYRENESLGGYDPYSASKACSEIATASYRNSFFNIDEFGVSHNTLIASARAGNVVGGGDWAKYRLIPDIVKNTNDGNPSEIRNPNSIRPWQHVLDALNGYLLLGAKLLEGKKEFSGAWNFGPLSLVDIKVKDILEISRKFWPKIQVTYRNEVNSLHEAGNLKLDPSKAYRNLGWQPKLDIEKTIELTISWYRSFYEQDVVITVEQINQFFNL